MAEDRSNAVLDAVKVFAEGGIVLVMDDFDRENECNLLCTWLRVARSHCSLDSCFCWSRQSSDMASVEVGCKHIDFSNRSAQGLWQLM